MNLEIPTELERQMANAQTALVSLMADWAQVEADLALAEAALSHHQHDYTRDLTGKPATFTPATHTHAYASSTHTHSYNDYKWVSPSGGYITRQTGGPV